MKALVISDIHSDFWTPYSREPLVGSEPTDTAVYKGLEFVWDTFSDRFPKTDAIIIPGDISNDFLTFVRVTKWLSKKYKKVYIVPGNHDATVRGGTSSESNLMFETTEQKFAAMENACRQLGNVFFLEGKIIDGIAGCMGVNDFKCDTYQFGPPQYIRWKKWYDGKYWRYFSQHHDEILKYYDETLTNLCSKQPKIIATHFVPYEAGVNFNYRNSQYNEMFFFQGEKYLNMLPDGALWLCGHVHDRKYVEYYTKDGKKITILCNPLGYPGEQTSKGDVWIYPKGEGTLQRKYENIAEDKYIIDIPD